MERLWSRKRIIVRRVVESRLYILYRHAKGFEIMDEYKPTFTRLTNMIDAPKRIITIAAIETFSTTRSIEIHIGLRTGTVRENRDLIDLVGSKNPKIIALMQRSISERIVNAFGPSGHNM